MLLGKLKVYFNEAKKIANKTNPSLCTKLHIFCDIIYCNIFLHCTLEEYRIYEFYKYKNSYRKNFILIHNKLRDYLKINPYRFAEHKKVFYKLIKRGIHRELLYLPEATEEQFLDFVKKHKKIITKPDVGSCGKNIQLFEYYNEQQAIKFYKTIKDKETICEEYIRQHDELNRLNPDCVNSIRIVTLLSGDDITFISASLKIGGQKNSFVDNMHQKGVGANVDIQTGVVTSLGYDYHDHSFIYHPLSKAQIIGFCIPFWSQTIELIKKTHLDVSECPLLGWDVAITNEGPEIIEINSSPGPRLMQLMDQKPKKTALIKYIKNHK